MIPLIDETHQVSLKSWVLSANTSETDFPIQNLPFGIFKRNGSTGSPNVGVAIGDQILDLAGVHRAGLFSGSLDSVGKTFADSSLNRLMGLEKPIQRELRRRISSLLSESNPEISAHATLVNQLLVPMAESEMFLPATIGDYTDFYASVHHATNVGRLFRPDQPLFPNYKYVPIGYHGRASSIVVSGTPIRRPRGQRNDDLTQAPEFVPSKAMDYEVEVGFLVGPGNSLGTPLSMAEAENQLFGMCLLNDWSARDIQKWEYQPLGPFLGKSFASTLSPWVVTMEALAPFRIPACARPEGDPPPLPYLYSADDQKYGGLDVTVELKFSSEKMREQGHLALRLSRNPVAELYWTPAQMVTHHTSNGCNLRTGDLLGSGTISGTTRDSLGSLLELNAPGNDPIVLPSNETRRFLADGDEISLGAFCIKTGFQRIGFGLCIGKLTPANPV